jgi:hypothetical protein
VSTNGLLLLDAEMFGKLQMRVVGVDLFDAGFINATIASALLA